MHWLADEFHSENIIQNENLEHKKYVVEVCTVVNKTRMIDLSRFSSWSRLISTTARIYKAVHIWKNRIQTPFQRYTLAEETCIK